MTSVIHGVPIELCARSLPETPTAERPAAGTAAMQLLVYGADQRSEAMNLWRQLEERLADAPLACSHAWTETWLEVYRDVVRPWFVVGVIENQIHGICLLSESRQTRVAGFPVCSLHLGTAGELHGESVCVEYNDILVTPRHRREFADRLQQLICLEPGWDQFQLDGIATDEDSAWPCVPPSGEHSDDITAKPALHAEIRTRESRYFDLEATRQQGSDVLSQLGKSTRANLKRRLKQIGTIEVEWAENLDQGLDIFEELVRLHQARWNAAGQPGAFASSRFHAFQKKLISRLLPRDQVVLARIKTPQATVGCLYLLVDRNRLLDYVSGFISFEEFPSPGLISHYLCMEAALRRGFDAYDFLVGEKRHKENLGKSLHMLSWHVHERPRLQYKLRNCLRTAKQLLKKALKST